MYIDFVLLADDIIFVPMAVCCNLWPNTFGQWAWIYGDSPSGALSEIRLARFQEIVLDRFNDYKCYLEWLLDLLGDQLPDFKAAFLDELHKQECPSSSLRL